MMNLIKSLKCIFFHHHYEFWQPYDAKGAITSHGRSCEIHVVSYCSSCGKEAKIELFLLQKDWEYMEECFKILKELKDDPT